MSTQDQNTLISTLDGFIDLFLEDTEYELSDEQLAVLGQLFTEQAHEVLGNFCNRIETSEDRAIAFARIVDDYYINGGMNEYEPPTTGPLLSAIEESLEHLEDHLEGNGQISRDDAGVLMINHGVNAEGLRDCTIEIRFPSRHGIVLWDRFEVALQFPVLTYSSFTMFAQLTVYEYQPIKPGKSEPPLYRYHPERFRSCHDFSEWLRRFFDLQIDKRSGLPTLEQLNQIGRHIIEELNTKAMGDIPLRPRLTSVQNTSAPMDATIALAMKWGKFVQSGKQIFDFPSAMIEMFKQTDVEDIPLNMVRMPYSCQFLHFGPQPELEIEPGWFVDGAYVERFNEEGDFAITVTACPADHKQSALWPGFPEPYFQQGFFEKYRTMDLGTAVDEVLSEELVGHQKQIGAAPAMKDITDNMMAEAAASGVDLPEGVTIIDRSSVNSVERLNTTSHRFPIYRSALRLVVNALCYMTAYPDDVQEAWPAETPERLKAQASAQKFKEARNAKSKLEALGYVPVHFCGRDWAAQVAEQHQHLAHGEGRKGVAIHWRRGHWKRQPHGEGRKLRKLIWIMPTLVGKDDGPNQEPLGHVYLVS